MPTPDHNATLDKLCRECAEDIHRENWTKYNSPEAMHAAHATMIAATVRRCIAQSPEVGAALAALETCGSRCVGIGEVADFDSVKVRAALAGLRKLVEGDK